MPRYLLSDDRHTDDLDSDSLVELFKVASERWRAGVAGLRIVDRQTDAVWSPGALPTEAQAAPVLDDVAGAP